MRLHSTWPRDGQDVLSLARRRTSSCVLSFITRLTRVPITIRFASAYAPLLLMRSTNRSVSVRVEGVTRISNTGQRSVSIYRRY
jgi:hypothetical protein